MGSDHRRMKERRHPAVAMCLNQTTPVGGGLSPIAAAGGSRLALVAGPARGQGSPKQQEKRQEKLDDIKRQVADGSLVIRKMTPAERKRNPAVPPKPRGRRGR
jgi:hypothetical protein